MKAWKLILVGILPAIMTGCVSQVKTQVNANPIESSPYYTGSYEAKPVPYRTLSSWMEKRKGDEEPKDILKTDFIVDDKRVLTPIYDILSQLLKGWPGKAPDLSVFIAVNPDRNIYGAKATIGNEILINYQTLLSAESDDELAAVLAHELAHVLLEHNKEMDLFNKAETLFDQYHSAKVIRELVQASSLKKTGDKNYTIDVDESIYTGMLQANRYKAQAGHYYHAFHGTMFSRGSEMEADLVAADLLIKAGYSPRGLQHSLERLTSAYETETVVHKALKESSKRIMDESMAAFKQTLLSYQEKGQLPEMDKVIDEAKGRIFDGVTGSVKDTAFTFLKSSHPVPEDRLENLAEHLSENYSRKERNKKTTTHLISAFHRSKAQEMLRRYEVADESHALALSSETSSAEKMRRKAISGVTAKDPYTRYKAYEVRRVQQKDRKALQNLELIDSFMNVPTNTVVPLVNLLAENKKNRAAIQAISEKEKYLGLMPAFYPAKIRIALNNKKTKEAKSLAEACIAHEDSTSEVVALCKQSGLLDAKQMKKPAGGFFNNLKSLSAQVGLPGS